MTMSTKKTKTLGELHEHHLHLETRVATVEANLDAMSKNIADLTTDVKQLAESTREQGQQFEAQMRELLVAVTNASGPRKTEWGVLVNALGLVLAIGAAVFAPLSMRISDNQSNTANIEQRFTAHEQLDSHPVSAVRLAMLEKQMHETEEQIMTDVHEHVSALQDELTYFRDMGTPKVNERLSVLEAKATFTCEKLMKDIMDKNGLLKTP